MTRRRNPDLVEFLRFETEAQLMNAIEANALQLGFMVYHTRVSIGSKPGFPDLFIVGHGAVFAIECKGPKAKVSDDQKRWIEELQRAGVSARFAYSTNDADFDEIMDDLQDAYEQAFARTAGRG